MHILPFSRRYLEELVDALQIAVCLRATISAPSSFFLSVHPSYSAAVTSFVREQANVIYEQSRRVDSGIGVLARPLSHDGGRRRRHVPRIPIEIPSVPIKLLFSARLLSCDDNGSQQQQRKERNRRANEIYGVFVSSGIYRRFYRSKVLRNSRLYL